MEGVVDRVKYPEFVEWLAKHLKWEVNGIPREARLPPAVARANGYGHSIQVRADEPPPCTPFKIGSRCVRVEPFTIGVQSKANAFAGLCTVGVSNHWPGNLNDWYNSQRGQVSSNFQQW